MVELVHDNLIVEIRIRFRGEILRVKGLNGDEQMVNTVSFVATYKQIPEVGIFQHRPEGVHALL